MILILDCGSNKTFHIESIVDEDSDYNTVALLDFRNEDLENIKGVIISGAPILVTEVDVEKYLDKVNWIKDTSIPVLGICFGHQIIGMLFGAYATRMKEDRDWQTVESFEDSMLFNRLPSEVQMMEDHCETISIPQSFKLIASSDACVNECMQHESKAIYGVQFHPEVSGNHGKVVISNFINSCLREVYH